MGDSTLAPAPNKPFDWAMPTRTRGPYLLIVACQLAILPGSMIYLDSFPELYRERLLVAVLVSLMLLVACISLVRPTMVAWIGLLLGSSAQTLYELSRNQSDVASAWFNFLPVVIPVVAILWVRPRRGRSIPS